jgi:hypothetical protein
VAISDFSWSLTSDNLGGRGFTLREISWLKEVIGSSPAWRWRLEAHPTEWWETRDNVWAVEVVGRRAAGGAQAVVMEVSGVEEEGGSERRAQI